VATFGFLGPRSGPITVITARCRCRRGRGWRWWAERSALWGDDWWPRGRPLSWPGASRCDLWRGAGGPTGVLTATDSADHQPMSRWQHRQCGWDGDGGEHGGEIGSAGTMRSGGSEERRKPCLWTMPWSDDDRRRRGQHTGYDRALRTR
jgi:hypothetical protein